MLLNPAIRTIHATAQQNRNELISAQQSTDKLLSLLEDGVWPSAVYHLCSVQMAVDMSFTATLIFDGEIILELEKGIQSLFMISAYFYSPVFKMLF